MNNFKRNHKLKDTNKKFANNTIKLVLILVVLTTNFVSGQQKANQTITKNNITMKTYVIERIIPGAGAFTSEQLKGISQTSCTVLTEMGPKIEWQHSYVTGDKVYCVYKAENKELIKEHARKGKFPANSISQVSATISPATAKQ